MRKLLDPLVSLIYPQFCNVCGGVVEALADGVACRACWGKVHLFGAASPLCSKCGLLLIAGRKGEDARCGMCDTHVYDRARAAGLYEFAILATILDLKKAANLPATAGKLIAGALELLPSTKHLLVIPVPLSKKRLFERGFNQALLLARAVARKHRLSLDEFSLVRTRDTPMHRSAMDRKSRELSVKGAFEVVRPALIKDRNILLVDDVMTSGATVSHCAHVLKRSGAASVNVLTLARAAM